MSKLESFIRRMTAQRDYLNHAAELIKDIPGVVFELGLGNGRTYDHLCQILPNRDIYVFDRRVASFPSCTPPPDHMFVGEILHTLKKAEKSFVQKVALVHIDLGTSDPSKKNYMDLIDSISDSLESVLLPGAVVVSNIRFNGECFHAIPETSGVKEGRYFLYGFLGSPSNFPGLVKRAR